MSDNIICSQCGEACGEVHVVNRDEPDRPLCEDCAANDFEYWLLHLEVQD
jgi:formylmethanofuran dehydrogenase subunit E